MTYSSLPPIGLCLFVRFFFQAEDGIRDIGVTGVQTCALPICAKLRDDPAAADRLLESSATELDAALAELRELARGIHPAVLSDRGLPAALEALASRSPVPVQLGDPPDERLPEAVEAAAYFVAAEALTNVAKYAQATRASVHVFRANGRVVVEVADDGVGGVDLDSGTGLRGLADRLAALDGQLDVVSTPGEGTIVRADIPCA